eukprot:scaffold228225_cov18-Tisochrysis_lutea.AAC.1
MHDQGSPRPDLRGQQELKVPKSQPTGARAPPVVGQGGLAAGAGAQLRKAAGNGHPKLLLVLYLRDLKDKGNTLQDANPTKPFR